MRIGGRKKDEEFTLALSFIKKVCALRKAIVPYHAICHSNVFFSMRLSALAASLIGIWMP
jgi:hypothetical protein